jgi:hypothetical protein
MYDTFASKLDDLGFELPQWCVPPTELLVRGFEARFSLRLPVDYRAFLLRHGGVIGSAICGFQEPTPCGPSTYIESFYGFTLPNRRGNVMDRTELIRGAPDVIAVGDNLMGGMFWLKCTGKDAGHVYMHDHEGRFAWPDPIFSERFPNLSPEIKQYLKQRKQGKLPAKPKGYEHVYRLAKSFTEFIDRLEPGEQ